MTSHWCVSSLPTGPVCKWGRRQALRYAYSALERQSMCDCPEAQAVADEAMDRLHTMPRAELNAWAARQLEYRWLTLDTLRPK